MEKIEIEVQELRKEVRELKDMINKLSYVMNKTSDHIDFVEGVYTSIRTPLDYIKKRVEVMTGTNNNQTSLPNITYIPSGISIGIAAQNADQK
jgi:glycerol-3-phosphate responsive antiterminator